MIDFGMAYVAKPTMQPAWVRIEWRDGTTTFHNLMPVFTDGKLSGTEWCARPFHSCVRDADTVLEFASSVVLP